MSHINNESFDSKTSSMKRVVSEQNLSAQAVN